MSYHRDIGRAKVVRPCQRRRGQGCLYPVKSGMIVLLALVACIALLSGCVIIPTNYYAPGSRHNVDATTQTNFTVGVTTKEDVLSKLGEPEMVSEDGRMVGYSWTKVKAIWFAGGYYTAAAGTIDMNYLLQIVFDEKNKVAETRLVKHLGSIPDSDQAQRLEPQQSLDIRLEPPSSPLPDSMGHAHGVAIRLLPVADFRLERTRIGERFAAFQVGMGQVYFSKPVPEYFEAALSDSLRRAGFRLVDSGEEVQMTVELRKFWVTTKTTPLYWDIIADVECRVGLKEGGANVKLQKSTFHGSAQHRAYVWPTASLMSKTLEQALDDLLKQISALKEFRDRSELETRQNKVEP